MFYQAIIADPAWSFGDRLTMSDVKRGAGSQYSTMSTGQIAALPVGQVADPAGCLLALWVPSSMLADGLLVMSEWGFVCKQTYVWVKTKKDGSGLGFGMGRLFRQSHEIALIGVNNTELYSTLENQSQRSVCLAPNQGHSIKPDCLHESIEVMFPKANKLELFARRIREGWLCLGNEIDGRDLRDSLPELILVEQLQMF